MPISSSPLKNSHMVSSDGFNQLLSLDHVRLDFSILVVLLLSQTALGFKFAVEIIES